METPQRLTWSKDLINKEYITSYTTVFLLRLLEELADEQHHVSVTNKELANMMNVPMSAIRRSLKELDKAGCIAITIVKSYNRTIEVKYRFSDKKCPDNCEAITCVELNDLLLKNKAVLKELKSVATEFKQYVSELRSCLSLARQMSTAGGNYIGQTSQFQTEKLEDQYTGTMPTQQDYQEILGYLNQKTGKGFRIENQNTKYIDGRWKKGYRTDDFKRVIDNKCNDWLRTGKRFSDGALAEDYLRPSTLFSEKNFEKYLNQTPLDEYGFPINSTQPGLSEWDKEIIENERKHGGHIF